MTTGVMPLIWVGNSAPAVRVEFVLLDFEGIPTLHLIDDFYNGGTNGGKISFIEGYPEGAAEKLVSGKNYGVSFGNNATAIIDADVVGNGNIANEPTPSTVLFWLSDNPAAPTPTMNVENGFELGFSFYYSSLGPFTVQVFPELNASGTPMTFDYTSNYIGVGASGTGVTVANLPAQYNDGAVGDPGGDFANWTWVSVLFTGVAKSVQFNGSSNQCGVDNIRIGWRTTDPPIVFTYQEKLLILLTEQNTSGTLIFPDYSGRNREVSQFGVTAFGVDCSDAFGTKFGGVPIRSNAPSSVSSVLLVRFDDRFDYRSFTGIATMWFWYAYQIAANPLQCLIDNASALNPASTNPPPVGRLKINTTNRSVIYEGEGGATFTSASNVLPVAGVFFYLSLSFRSDGSVIVRVDGVTVLTIAQTHRFRTSRHGFTLLGNVVSAGVPPTESCHGALAEFGVIMDELYPADFAPPVAPATIGVSLSAEQLLDPAYSSAHYTYGDAQNWATRTSTGFVSAVKTLSTKSTGKYIVGITRLSGDPFIIAGFAPAGHPSTSYPGQTAGSYGCLFYSSGPQQKVTGGAFTPLTGTPGLAIGQTGYVAIDFDAGKIWYVIAVAGGPLTFFEGGLPNGGTGQSHTFTPNTPMHFVASTTFAGKVQVHLADLGPNANIRDQRQQAVDFSVWAY
jgi:hypothetical protein